jgi:acyl-CoA reductase-like NAD-dependent aldehyde dehydrogenase
LPGIPWFPSELTPATAELTVQLWQQADPGRGDQPAAGRKATGQALLENRDIDGVLFTGSAAAGSISIATSAASRRRCWRWRWAATTR